MENFHLKSESGSALVTVIVFILIVTLTITVVLHFNRRQQRQLVNKGLKLQTYHNAESVVYKLLTEKQPFLQQIYNDSKGVNDQLSLFGNDTTGYFVDRYGLLLRIKVISKIKNQQSERSFLIGKKEDDRFNKALILGNKKSPLILTGSTIVEGDVITGLKGVRAGVLKGRRFQGDNLVLGSVIRDPSYIIPTFHNINSYASNAYKNNNKTIQIHNSVFLLNDQTIDINQDKIESWKSKGIKTILGPGKLLSSTNLVFDGLALLNQIEISTDSTVFFGQNSYAEQIVVNAGSIRINNSKELSGQFIARGWIDINNSILKYPSIIAAFITGINVGAGSVINGTVILSTPDRRELDEQKIIIDANARINGFVYTNQYTEIEGQVHGTIMTNNFHFYLSPTTYINWINGATISRPAYKDNFVIPVGFNTKNEFLIVDEI